MEDQRGRGHGDQSRYVMLGLYLKGRGKGSHHGKRGV